MSLSQCLHGRVHAILEWDGTTCHVSKNAANVFVMHSPPSYSTSDKVLQGLSAMLPDVTSCFPAHVTCCFLAHVIPPDDDADDASHPAYPSTPLPSHVLCVTNGSDPSSLDCPMWSNHTPSCEHEHEHKEHDHKDTHPQVPFDLEDMLPVVENGEPTELNQVSLVNPTASLLHWYYCLGHISFKVLQQMAKQGIINKALAHCAVLKSSACLFGKATKRAWRMKSSPSHVSPITITVPHDCVLVDQLESLVPGMIAQL